MKRLSLVAFLWLIAIVALPALAFAQYTSTNYKTSEVFFGSGGDSNQSSANYKANTSLGGLGSGKGSSTNYQAYSGFLTPNEPFLNMTINTAAVSLGNLSTSSTATGTANFTVTAYVDSGYTVQTVSTAPKYTSGATSHTLTGMTQTATTVGKEEFGINLRANTSPASFGADPANQPAGSGTTFANGIAAPGYNNQNQYKYSQFDTIACTGSGSTCGNTSGWGETIFTISYVADISPITPAGNYSVTHDLVVVATF